MLLTQEAGMSTTSKLRRGLSQRQLNMIAIGGVIGAGLFVGSGVIIGETGPAAFVTYAPLVFRQPAATGRAIKRRRRKP